MGANFNAYRVIYGSSSNQRYADKSHTSLQQEPQVHIPSGISQTSYAMGGYPIGHYNSTVERSAKRRKTWEETPLPNQSGMDATRSAYPIANGKAPVMHPSPQFYTYEYTRDANRLKQIKDQIKNWEETPLPNQSGMDATRSAYPIANEKAPVMHPSPQFSTYENDEKRLKQIKDQIKNWEETPLPNQSGMDATRSASPTAAGKAPIATPLTDEDLNKIKSCNFQLRHSRDKRNGDYLQKLKDMFKLLDSIYEGKKTVTSENMKIFNELVGTTKTFIQERTNRINERIAANKSLIESDNAIKASIETLKKTLEKVKESPEGIIGEGEIRAVYAQINMNCTDNERIIAYNKKCKKIQKFTEFLFLPGKRRISDNNLSLLYYLHMYFKYSVNKHYLPDISPMATQYNFEEIHEKIRELGKSRNLTFKKFWL